MTPTVASALAVLLAYLIGSIPFAYVVVKLAKGIDIRSIGSGNVGATNAGRILGLKGFLLVFVLDFLKGLLPTVGLPWLVRKLAGETVADLSVLLALGTILGHNFPIFLRFQGGKGVATSLGALFGLDWMASLAAAIGFGTYLKISRYVSLSSLVGAAAFVLVHFLRVRFGEHASAWDRDHFAFSVLTLGLFVMLVVRHRKNWARIREGTEPKIGRKAAPPSGRVAITLVVCLALVAIGSILVLKLTRAATLDCGEFTLSLADRVNTGHQRAESPRFFDDGNRLAVLCPRYDRLMIYRVDPTSTLELERDVKLQGQPVALASSGDRLVMLTRPSGDARHVAEGHVAILDRNGEAIRTPIAIGYYPTDLALIDGGRKALVLTSGSAEGAAHRPPPALQVVDLEGHRILSSLAFRQLEDAPDRLAVSSSGANAAVSMTRTKAVVAIDLSDAENPREVGRTPLPARENAYPSVGGDDWILMPVASDRRSALLSPPGTDTRKTPFDSVLVSTLPEESGLEVCSLASSKGMGRLALRGSANLGMIRPTGVDVASDRGWIAVTGRSGNVLLVRVSRPETAETTGTSIGRISSANRPPRKTATE